MALLEVKNVKKIYTTRQCEIYGRDSSAGEDICIFYGNFRIDSSL